MAVPLIKGFSFRRPASSVEIRGRRPGHLDQVYAKGLENQPKPTLVTLNNYDSQHLERFIDWIPENFYDPTTVNMFGKEWDYSVAKKLILSDRQSRICNHVLTPDHNGIFPYRTIVYSTIKKEGKTTLAGGVGSWWGACVEPPNLILTLANDQEQSAGRIFGAMLPTLYALGCKVPFAQSSKPEVRLPNGTLIQAIANNYAGAAGGNYGLTLWSELWAYTTERSRRLYDELVPVPTRKNSLRWIETYVGFEDESDLLLQIFKRIFVDTSESRTQPDAKPVPGLEDIQTDGRPACWHIPEEGLFYYHNHERTMPWNLGEIGDKFIAAQKADLRHSQFVRLWQNRWQSSEGSFIDPDYYTDSVIYTGEDLSEPMFIAGDASQRHDSVALLGVRRIGVYVFGEYQERYKLCYIRVWDPEGKDIDLEETIAAEVERLHELGMMIGPFNYDSYQMHQVAVNLRKKGVPCVEFSQQTDRTKSDTFLWKQFHTGKLGTFPSAVLEQHCQAAKAKELDNEQIRIVKGRGNRSARIDACVALSMAVWKASQFRPRTDQEEFSTSVVA